MWNVQAKFEAFRRKCIRGLWYKAFFQIIARLSAPVAKLDKAPVYETGDYRFESCQVHHLLLRAS